MAESGPGNILQGGTISRDCEDAKIDWPGVQCSVGQRGEGRSLNEA